MGCPARKLTSPVAYATPQVLVNFRRPVVRSASSRVFGEAIARVRDERGLSLSDLAIALDCDRKDAFAIVHGGKATAEQLETVLRRTEPHQTKLPGIR